MAFDHNSDIMVIFDHSDVTLLFVIKIDIKNKKPLWVEYLYFCQNIFW